MSTGKDNLLNAWRTPYGASIFQVNASIFQVKKSICQVNAALPDEIQEKRSFIINIIIIIMRQSNQLISHWIYFFLFIMFHSFLFRERLDVRISLLYDLGLLAGYHKPQVQYRSEMGSLKMYQIFYSMILEASSVQRQTLRRNRNGSRRIKRHVC